ncbi:hypothetical protein GR247_32655 [Rhizobium leguminosarum]|nr:hypothetical protein [Rhizobium leguminosarum]
MIDTERNDATMLNTGTGDFRPAQKKTKPAANAKNQKTRTSPIALANTSNAPEDTETTVSNRSERQHDVQHHIRDHGQYHRSYQKP